MRAAVAANQDNDGEDFLLRPAAAEYLTRRLGRPVTVSSMQRWASEGRGPGFVVILGKASFTRADLDAWIKSPDAQRKRGGWRGGPKKD